MNRPLPRHCASKSIIIVIAPVETDWKECVCDLDHSQLFRTWRITTFRRQQLNILLWRNSNQTMTHYLVFQTFLNLLQPHCDRQMTGGLLLAILFPGRPSRHWLLTIVASLPLSQLFWPTTQNPCWFPNLQPVAWPQTSGHDRHAWPELLLMTARPVATHLAG